jgi:hypothetical protein
MQGQHAAKDQSRSDGVDAQERPDADCGDAERRSGEDEDLGKGLRCGVVAFAFLSSSLVVIPALLGRCIGPQRPDWAPLRSRMKSADAVVDKERENDGNSETDSDLKC